MTGASTPADRLVDAEREAALARERLTDTVGALQQRLDPRTLARETRALASERMRHVSDRGGAVAQASLDTAKRNPGAVAGVAAGLGLFVIARAILGLLHRRRAAAPPPPPVQAPAPPPVIEGPQL